MRPITKLTHEHEPKRLKALSDEEIRKRYEIMSGCCTYILQKMLLF